MSIDKKSEIAKAKGDAFFAPKPATEADAHRQAAQATAAAEAEKIARLRAARLAKEQSDVIAASVRRSRRDLRRP